jgi:KDO2-lipid IV(A) lauroyltransferase
LQSQFAKIMINKGFSYIGIIFLFILSVLPFSIIYFLAYLLYYPLYYLFRYRRPVVRGNLLNSFPEKTLSEIVKIEKDFYRYLITLILEIIKMSTISEFEIKKRVKFINTELLQSYLDQGQSVLGSSGHYGNWEWGMIRFGILIKQPKYVIYKPLRNRTFDKWFFDMRSKFGNTLIAMRQTLRTLANTKDKPTVFLFASDQTPLKEESHYWIDFLNQPTAVLLGLEKIALQTNRPVFYFKTRVVKRGYYEIDCVPLCLNPAQSVEHEITDKNFKFLEDLINNQPAYWLWSHRRWKHKPI